MIKIAFFALLLVVFASATIRPVFQGTVEQQFQQFKTVFGKTYKSDLEEQQRFKIFASSFNITRSMTEASKGKTQYGVTQFSDLTPEEFQHLYLMKKLPDVKVEGKHLKVKPVKNIPSFHDWRYVKGKNGYSSSCISPVYNQGQCGSCWAFSATEQIESMTCLQDNTGSAPNLAMQQIVDCDTTCYGCNGGWTYLAYQYVQQAGGLDTLASYPYTAQDGNCAYNPSNVDGTITGWAYVGQNNEATMLSYITSTGPLSICVDAASWQYYQGGVITSGCGQSVDHCVQLTGYSGNVQGVPAWIVRNSWGTSWGYSGYLYVEYGQNMCAIASTPTTVTAGPQKRK